ncbi:hypothetical protein GS449_14080 [Rhodococcus hoagii]|nr:hypothetical protein [Prescottella equi]
MGNNLTYTITGCEPDGGKYEGMSLYTATADGTTFVLEAPSACTRSARRTRKSSPTSVQTRREAGRLTTGWEPA